MSSDESSFKKKEMEEYIVHDEHILKMIESGLRETYFADYDAGFLETEYGVQDLEANVFKRYDSCLSHIIPWVSRCIDLSGKRVLEVGTGTGSSAAAFAHFVDSVYTFDIHEPSVRGALTRFDALGLTNIQVDLIQEDAFLETLNSHPDESIDIVLLSAVLEHQTIEERLATLTTCWRLLRDNGIMVVTDTPNLLVYFDFHSSVLPFLHMTPTDLYVRYAKHSPRNGFNKSFDDYEIKDYRELDVQISRWGRGVSYHDFELAFGSGFNDAIVASGFEKEILSWVDVCFEEELLRFFVHHKHMDVHDAFTRAALNFILKKGDEVEKRHCAAAPDFQHISSPQEMLALKGQLAGMQQLVEHKDRHLADILTSKRWKLLTSLTSPYRYLNSLVTKKQRR